MKSRNKKKYIIAITAILLAACIAAVTGIFAWMTSTKSISKVGFRISQISCRIRMYKGLESDYNGVPDLLGVGLGKEGKIATDSSYGQYQETTGTSTSWTDYTYEDIYYGEKYAFELLDSKSMLSSKDTEANSFDVALDEVEPSRVYIYKFSIANEKGGGAGYLSFSFDDFTGSAEMNEESENKTWASLDASAFQCRMFVVKNNNQNKSKLTTDIKYDKYTTTDSTTNVTTEWFDLSTAGTALTSNVAIAKVPDTQGSTNAGDIVDIWLQIRMNPKVANAVNNTENIFKQSVTLPNFTISFNTTKSSA